MADILIFDNDEYQLNWAYAQLSGVHNLTLLASEFEAGLVDMSAFDFVFTDGVLPEWRDSIPKLAVGVRIFEEAFHLLRQGDLKGVAFVSNYEHHIHRKQTDPWDELRQYKEKSFSFLCDEVSVGSGEKVNSLLKKFGKDDRPLNSILVIDMYQNYYRHIIDPNGNVHEIATISVEMPRDYPPWQKIQYACTEKGYTLAKPWKKVVEVLELPK